MQVVWVCSFIVLELGHPDVTYAMDCLPIKRQLLTLHLRGGKKGEEGEWQGVPEAMPILFPSTATSSCSRTLPVLPPQSTLKMDECMGGMECDQQRF